MTYGIITWQDRSKEKATMTFNLPALLADGSNYAAITAAFAAVQAAVAAVTEGSIFETALVADRTRVSNAIPTDGRREQKFLVRYQDDTTLKVYNLEIPLSDETAMPYNSGTDFVDIGNADPQTAALIAALNTNVKSPVGNDITVISIESVGRNI